MNGVNEVPFDETKVVRQQGRFAVQNTNKPEGELPPVKKRLTVSELEAELESADQLAGKYNLAADRAAAALIKGMIVEKYEGASTATFSFPASDRFGGTPTLLRIESEDGTTLYTRARGDRSDSQFAYSITERARGMLNPDTLLENSTKIPKTEFRPVTFVVDLEN